MTYTISDENVIPPKQYALGLTAHQISGRNKRLVNLLHNGGQSISYKQCLQADTALSETTLQKRDPETGAIPPVNLVHGRKVQFGQDNIDCSKESSIAGHNAGYHGTQMVEYQPGPAMNTAISDIVFSKSTIDVIHKSDLVLSIQDTINVWPSPDKPETETSSSQHPCHRWHGIRVIDEN